jgi:hypothetical protein
MLVRLARLSAVAARTGGSGVLHLRRLPEGRADSERRITGDEVSTPLGGGSVEPEGLLSGLDPRAIALGVVVDTVLTILAVFPLVVLFGSEALASEDEAVAKAAFEALVASTDFLVASLAVGLVCTAIGAFVGARRAGCEFLRHGGWIAVGSALLSLLVEISSADGGSATSPLWVDLAGPLLMLPAGLVGGALAARAALAQAPRD